MVGVSHAVESAVVAPPDQQGVALPDHEGDRSFAAGLLTARREAVSDARAGLPTRYFFAGSPAREAPVAPWKTPAAD